MRSHTCTGGHIPSFSSTGAGGITSFDGGLRFDELHTFPNATASFDWIFRLRGLDLTPLQHNQILPRSPGQMEHMFGCHNSQ